MIISIHAPLAGSDLAAIFFSPVFLISIHAPLAGSDYSYEFKGLAVKKFQSTLPSRGATNPSNLLAHLDHYFNPRSPRGERRIFLKTVTLGAGISIHAPLAGSDILHRRPPSSSSRFQSTLPSRGATELYALRSRRYVISIHAPLAGSDSSSPIRSRRCVNFNPRSPRGERPAPPISSAMALAFQSTLPSRGATMSARAISFLLQISIHAPLAGSDDVPDNRHNPRCYFNPRSPRGERLGSFGQCLDLGLISIHAPLAGSDQSRGWIWPRNTNFNPRSPRGERPTTTGTVVAPADFNPRSPRGERPCCPPCYNSKWKFQSTLPSRGATRPAL